MVSRLFQDSLVFLLFFIITICSAKQTQSNSYSSLLDTSVINNSYALDDIDLILNNADLRSYRFMYEKEGFYQQIVRLSFLQSLIHVTIEIGITDENTYDLIIKYGEGNRIKFNDFPYFAEHKKNCFSKILKILNKFKY
jgi:hypothetical protein